MSEGVCLHEIIYNDAGQAVDYEIIDVNPAYESYFSIKRKDVIGQMATELFGLDRPDFMDVFADVAASGKSTTMEAYFPHVKKHFSLSVFSPEKGKFATMFYDITKRKQAEEALAQEAEVNKIMAELTKTIITGMSIEDISAIVLEKAKQLTESPFGFVGYIEPDTDHLVCPTLIRDIWDTCQVPEKNIVFHEFKGLWGWVLKNGKPLLTNTATEDYRSSGIPESHLPIKRFLSAPAMLGDNLVGQIALANGESDYTEKDLDIVERLATLYAIAIQRRRAVEELQKAHDELEERIKKRTAELQLAHDQLLHTEKLSAIGELSASIAHEFNNPLFGIRTVLGGIKQRAPLDKDDSELVDMAVQECDRMKYLIQDLQDFNRPTSGEMAPLDVHKAIDSILLLFKNEFKQQKIMVEKQYAANLPTIQAVPDQIRQILLNLLRNAGDAIQKGGGTIAITTEILDEKKVAIQIRDSGVGIKPEDLDHIFEPFFSTKPEVTGTGLGLAVSYGIIKKHQGDIKVKSEVGKGTTFTIILPIDVEA